MMSMKLIVFYIFVYVNGLNMVQTRGLTRYKNSFILNVARNMNSKPCPLLENFDNIMKKNDNKIVWASVSGPWEIKYYNEIEEMLSQQGEVSMLE